MDVSKITNANLYMAGTANLVGKLSELTLPKVTAVTEEHQALGMIGKIKLPTGIELLEATAKWKGFYKEAFAACDPFSAVQFQARASVQTFGAAGPAATKPLLVEFTARFTEFDLGALVAAQGNEQTTALNVTYIKVSLDGEELVEVDPVHNVWRVRGRDLLESWRTQLGV